MKTRKPMPEATKAAGDESLREAQGRADGLMVQDEGRRGLPGAVFYRVVSEQPPIIEATVVDQSGRTWTATGPRCRAAYHGIVAQLEAVAQKDTAANALFGVIDGLPPDELPGPLQGSLFGRG